MKISASNEFRISPFARFYEPITDSFINIKQVSDSLKNHLTHSKKELFEIGLGTGYFATQFTKDGYRVKGIQPVDEMLSILKLRNTDIEIMAECKLEDYQFTEKYETIVSHSSVFLFTEHESQFGRHGEKLKSYIFQSFITNEEMVLNCLHKTLQALMPHGRLFINIQTNPQSFITIETSEQLLTFEMAQCNYFLELGYVEKKFNLTFKGQTFEVKDTRFCETFTKFADQVQTFGFKATVSEDRYWVIIKRM
jgi:hypothetical protein